MMDMICIEPARFGHVPQLVNLLASAVPDCSPQTVWDIPWSWPDYWVLTEGQRVIGTGALRSVDDSRCELRGLAIDAAHRGRGLARLLVRHLLEQSRASERETLCVTRCPDFFRRMGFATTHPFWLDLEPARWPVDDGVGRVPMSAPARDLPEGLPGRVPTSAAISARRMNLPG